MGRTRRLIAAALAAAVAVAGAGWKWHSHAASGGQQRAGWVWNR
jgi:hypothetical protein